MCPSLRLCACLRRRERACFNGVDGAKDGWGVQGRDSGVVRSLGAATLVREETAGPADLLFSSRSLRWFEMAEEERDEGKTFWTVH